jgi:hypothetical protein
METRNEAERAALLAVVDVLTRELDLDAVPIAVVPHGGGVALVT